MKAEPAKAEGAKKLEAATGAPEKYEAFKVPEGYEIDTKVVEEVSPLFKELNLSQDQAQKLVDVWNKHSAASADNAIKQYEQMRLDNRNAVIKNPTLGNGSDGLKPEVRANIDKAINAIGDPKAIASFKEAMDLTGVGDYPAFVAAINAWGKLFSEGTLVRGGSPSQHGQSPPGKDARPSPAQAMYPNNPSSATS